MFVHARKWVWQQSSCARSNIYFLSSWSSFLSYYYWLLPSSRKTAVCFLEPAKLWLRDVSNVPAPSMHLVLCNTKQHSMACCYRKNNGFSMNSEVLFFLFIILFIKEQHVIVLAAEPPFFPVLSYVLVVEKQSSLRRNHQVLKKCWRTWSRSFTRTRYRHWRFLP